MWKTLWGTPTRKWITSVLTTITLVAGTITAVNAAFPIVEPILFAHRAWVRDYSTPTTKRVTEIALALNEIEQRGLVKDLRNIEDQLKGDDATKNPQYKAALQLGVDRMKRDLSALEIQGKKLRLELGE